jgi:hypothetical protein
VPPCRLAMTAAVKLGVLRLGRGGDDCVLGATLEKSLGTAQNSLCLGRESVMVTALFRSMHTNGLVAMGVHI